MDSFMTLEQLAPKRETRGYHMTAPLQLLIFYELLEITLVTLLHAPYYLPCNVFP